MTSNSARHTPTLLHLRTQTSAWFVLFMGIVLTGLVATIERQQTQLQAEQRFGFAAEQVALRIDERLHAYALMLRGAAGLFKSSELVTRHEWASYVNDLRLEENLSPVQGVGFSQLIPAQQLQAHIAAIVEEGFEDYSVTPAGAREVYSSITYLEPFEGRNLRAFGFDMFSEPVRRQAMERARDLNEASMSGRVELVQETDTDIQAGILLYVPVYWHNMPLDTPEQRQRALRGWAYSPFRMTDLMLGLIGDWSQVDMSNLGLRIYDGKQSSDALMFTSAGLAEHSAPDHRTHQTQLSIHGRQWLLEFEALSATQASEFRSMWFVLIFGTAVSVLLFALMLSLARTRDRALRIAERLTHEISEREVALKAASAEAEHFREALEHVNSYIYIKDVNRLYQYANKACLDLFGRSNDTLKNAPDEDFFPAETCEQLKHIDELVLRGEKTRTEVEVRSQDGSRQIYLEIKSPIYDDKDHSDITGILGISTDITALKLREEDMERIAHYDSLTLLPNRLLLADRLRQAMAHTNRQGNQLALVYLDLDGFKAINDRFGHAVGDQLLQLVATRLKDSVRDGDTVARIGGDEFVAVLQDIQSLDNVKIVLERMMHAAADPIHLQGQTMKVSASMGVSLYPQHSEVTEDQLMRQADQAMYQAKNAGRRR
ncbi:MAG: CHASE domain-containing protein, partial [Pseudohongiella sp.]|nr:CHASE domain-containing protein [Pseudohongiella sp.]